MAIDIRATVTCSLGTLISGSISDDYIQGSGLVKTRGSVEISGTITPAIGTAVTFGYTKGGVTRSIPRKLRVMSSFADPFRRTTKVELGCKLTYLSDLKEPLDWTAFDDPQNSSYVAEDARIVTLPIYASSVMNKCLTELGISASSNPLTNKFSIAAFDFGAGYVSVLNDLLISESYCGYLDTNEVLQVFALDQDAGTGPVFTASDIVDLGPIGVGSLPGEAVTVSYSTLKLKAPDNTGDNTTRTLWEQEEEVSEVAYYYIAYDGGTAVYSGRDVTTSTTKYKDVPANKLISGNYYSVTGDTKNVVDKRTVEVTSPTIKGLGQLASAKLSNGIYFPATETLASRTITNYSYDPTGELVRTEILEYEDQAFAAYRLGIPLVIGTNYVEVSNGLKLISRTINTDEKYGEFTKRVTSNYVWWPLSQVGQQAVAEAKDSFTTVAAVSSYVTDLLGAGLVHNATQINTTRLGLAGFEGRPSSTELTNGAYAKDGDPNNGWRTESVADLELALGSATAQRRIELSMPYAPDDTFSGPTGGPFTAVASDAPAKANRYGRVQNRLLLGNRSGINLQLAPEKLPAAPYSPLYVQASGLTALYRANGTNWAFDSNGIVCSVDALFWAAVGGTGTFWFPVAPGITTLPAEPPIVDGAMNASNTVLPYNETAIYDSLIRLSPVVTKFDYSLTLLTTVPPTPIKIKTVVQRALPASPGTFALSGQDAQLKRPNRVLIAAAGTFALTDQFVRFKPDRLYPTDPGIFTLNLQAAPLTYSGGDPFWNEVKLLLHMNGTNGSTTFTDSGPLGLTATRNGNTVISTAQSKFGGASAYFDGSGDNLQYADNDAWNLGANNFTIEAWVFPTSIGTFPVATQRIGPSSEYAWEFIFSDIGLTFFSTTNPAGATNIDEFIWSGSFSINAWMHVAVSRIGNTLRLFKNGVLVYTNDTYSISIRNSTASMLVGGRGSTGASALGYIDDLRITKAGRYAATFTPSSKAFHDGPQTV